MNPMKITQSSVSLKEFLPKFIEEPSVRFHLQGEQTVISDKLYLGNELRWYSEDEIRDLIGDIWHQHPTHFRFTGVLSVERAELRTGVEIDTPNEAKLEDRFYYAESQKLDGWSFEVLKKDIPLTILSLPDLALYREERAERKTEISSAGQDGVFGAAVGSGFYFGGELITEEHFNPVCFSRPRLRSVYLNFVNNLGIEAVSIPRFFSEKERHDLVNELADRYGKSDIQRRVGDEDFRLLLSSNDQLMLLDADQFAHEHSL